MPSVAANEVRTTMENWKPKFIRFLFHYSRKRIDQAAADLIKQRNMPSTLYKFRRFSDHHKQALQQGVLWRTAPRNFNDPYDSVVYFDTSRLLMEDMDYSALRAEIEAIKTNAASWRPKPTTHPISRQEWLEKHLFSRLPKKQSGALRNANEVAWRRIQEESVKQMSDSVRLGYSVICFAGDTTSVLMWSHYSQDHRGFCIQYDLTNSELGRVCYPVFYRKKLTDFTRYIFKENIEDRNNLFAIYASILKSDEWSYEREWRIVLPLGRSTEGPVCMPKPKAIILGALVDPEDANWMTQFCASQSIPLRKMKQHFHEFRLEIVDV